MGEDELIFVNRTLFGGEMLDKAPLILGLSLRTSFIASSLVVPLPCETVNLSVFEFHFFTCPISFSPKELLGISKCEPTRASGLTRREDTRE